MNIQTLREKLTPLPLAVREALENCIVYSGTTTGLIEDALQGDMVVSISPATVSTTAITGAWTRNVEITLKNAAGDTHTWCNLALSTGVSIANDSTAGTATIPSTTLTFSNGVATVTVTGSAHAWLADETDTLTVATLTILGYSVTGGTSVETFVAA